MFNSAHRLLVVSRHSPLPQNDGAGAYLFDLLTYLHSEGTRIELLWLQPDTRLLRSGWLLVPPSVHRVARLHLPGAIAWGRLRLFPAIWWLPLKARVLHAVKSALSLLPPLRRRFQQRHRARVTAPAAPARSNWSALPSPAETALFRRVHRRVRPAAVLANYCWLAPLLDQARGCRKLILTHDVASHRLPLTGAARFDLPAELNPALPAGEAALLAKADAILAISGADAGTFRAMVPARTVLVVPKAARLHARDTTRCARGRCLFVGGRNPPNEEGLKWFVAEVWPRVLAARPDARLHVCGGVSEAAGPVPSSVVLRGRVDDLTPEYAAAEVVIVPLLRGTGMKIKLVEAAGHGRACVTTPVGLQGMEFFREAVLCADEASAFASAVVRVLEDADLREQLGRSLQLAARSRLAPSAAYGPVARWLAPAARARTTSTSSAAVPA